MEVVITQKSTFQVRGDCGLGYHSKHRDVGDWMVLPSKFSIEIKKS